MKTTIEISDSLLRKAKRVARAQGITLKSLTEEGLKKVIEERTTRQAYKVEPVTFHGKGLSKEYQGASWNEIRDTAYKGRGS